MWVNGSRNRVENTLSKAFQVSNGLREGDSLIPLFFNIALDMVVKTAYP